jgi:hypothetical protein
MSHSTFAEFLDKLHHSSVNGILLFMPQVRKILVFIVKLEIVLMISSQAPIHEQLPPLTDDITNKSSVSALLSFRLTSALSAATGGAIEAVHCIPTDRLISVVSGSQRVTLIPSSRNLYPKKDPNLLFASQVSSCSCFSCFFFWFFCYFLFFLCHVF